MCVRVCVCARTLDMIDIGLFVLENSLSQIFGRIKLHKKVSIIIYFFYIRINIINAIPNRHQKRFPLRQLKEYFSQFTFHKTIVKNTQEE